MMQLGIAGANGRVGQALKLAIEADPRVHLKAASARASLNADITPGGCYTRNYTPQELMTAVDAVIDFTHPAYSLELAETAAKLKKIHVIGTTGFTESEMEKLRSFAKTATIVWSSNMSLGVNVVSSLVKKAASILGTEYDIEVSEMHHKHKKDSPSGTALLLAQAAAEGRGVKLSEVERMYAKGMIGEREVGTIGLSVKRGGDIVGEHDVIFAGPGEMITIRHEGFNRDIYARGAIAAALWAQGKPAGFYSMQDVLGLA